MQKAQNHSKAVEELERAVEKPSQWLSNTLSCPREEGYVSVDGCDIRFYRWGDPSKPGIVMMHGFLAHSHCWTFIAPYLADDYHVVAFDLSGMGESGWREEYSEAIRVEELIAVCHETGLFNGTAKPMLIAHSFSGRIACAAVHTHPTKFNGLIICDLMIIRPSILKQHAKRFEAPGKRDPSKPNRVYPDFQTAKQRFVLAPPQEVEKTELFDYMAFHSLKEVEGGWQWKFDPRVFSVAAGIESAWTKTGARLVSAPVRKAIVHGSKSALFTADSVAYIAELVSELRQATFPVIAIPEARHHLMLDQPIAVTAALRSVLGAWATEPNP